MTCTPTFRPTDGAMWRKLLARAYPDAGGNHELFIWVGSVKEHVLKSTTASQASSPPSAEPRSEPRTVYEDGRVPFPADSICGALTATAIERAGAVGMLYRRLLLLLEDCYTAAHLPHEEQRGASYKRLAFIAHLVGMSKGERVGWYRVAEFIPLADRHAGHIIKRLKEAA